MEDSNKEKKEVEDTDSSLKLKETINQSNFITVR